MLNAQHTPNVPSGVENAANYTLYNLLSMIHRAVDYPILISYPHFLSLFSQKKLKHDL